MCVVNTRYKLSLVFSYKVLCNLIQVSYLCKGHTSKVFHVKWSPLKDGILCTGSDDTYVILFL